MSRYTYNRPYSPPQRLRQRYTPGANKRYYDATWHEPRPWFLRVRAKAVIVVAILIGLWALPHIIQSKQASAQETAEKAQQSAVVDQQRQAFTGEVNQVLANYPGIDVSVDTISSSDSTAQIGTTTTFDGASTGKILTAIDYLHHVEAGSAKLSTRIHGIKAQTWLQKMVVDSDDTAWLYLNTYLSHADLGRYAASVGFGGYDPDTNTFPASDMAPLLQKLYTQKLLNPSDTQLLLSYMKQANYQNYILPAVPSEYTVYHKVGIDEAYIHDVAIIVKGDKYLVLTIYTNGNGDQDAGARAELMQSITKAALTTYFSS